MRFSLSLLFPHTGWITSWFLAVLLTALPPGLPSVGAGEGGYEVIANAYGFACEIPGAPHASKNIREIAIDELNIDVREMTTGLDVEYRFYGPGTPHFGNAKFSVLANSEASQELHAWYQEASRGKNIRKNISVRLFKNDKTPGRGYTLFDCFPSQWSSVSFDSRGGVQTETLTVKIGRIEFTTRVAGGGSGPGQPGTPPPAGGGATDEFAPVRGFKVEIVGSSGKEVDTAWESVSGGDLVIEMTEASIGSDKFSTFSPGHKTVSEIQLRGAMTDGRKALCEWINDTVQGKPWKQMLTITEMLSVDGGVKDGRATSGIMAMPVRYKFPLLSVDRREGNVEEEVEIRWVRLTPELPPHVTGVLDIPGAPEASAQAILIGIEDLALDVALVDTQGDARNPSARIAIRATGRAVAELEAWVKQAAAGIDDPRTLQLALQKKGKGPVRTFNLVDCFPQALYLPDPATPDVLRLEVKMQRVELK